MLRMSRLCAVLLALSAAPAAMAQEDPWDNQDPEARAKELYQNGAILYEEGRYEDAVVAWDEAYHLSQRPALLYNIANAQERLGLWQEALDTLNRYRAYAGAGQRDVLDRRITNLERRLQDSGGETSNTIVEAEPIEPMVGAAPTGRPITGGGAGPRIVPLVLMGGGAAFLATGGVFALSAGSARRSAADSCAADALGSTWCLDTASSDLTRDRRSSLLADVSFVLGTAGLATGGALMLFSPGATQVGVGPGQIVIRGSFK